MSNDNLYDWITTTGADILRADGFVEWESPATGRRYAWSTAHGFEATISGCSVGPNSDSAVYVVDNGATPETYADSMRETARYLAETIVRLMLDLDEALTDVIRDTGVGEEIGTSGALREMCRRRAGEQVSVSFASDHVKR